MKPKRENNKYDIVLEAEAVLQAYAERCKIYVGKSERRKRGRLKRLLCGVFLGVLCAAVVLGIKSMF